MTDPTQPTDRLVDAVVRARWAVGDRCGDPTCPAVASGDGIDCSAARGAVESILGALAATPYAVLLDVAAEMDRQDRKFGVQDHPDVDPVVLARLDHDDTWGGPRAVAKRLAEEYEVPTAERARYLCQSARPTTWMGITLEELTETLEATTTRDPAKVRGEAIQTAASGAQWARAIDRREARERCKTTTHVDAPCGPHCILAATPARVTYAELTTELAPRRIGEALASVGYRQVDDWGPVVNGRCRANVEQVEPADDEVCGEAYDHDLRPISERDGACTYECRRCGAEVISETADNA